MDLTKEFRFVYEGEPDRVYYAKEYSEDTIRVNWDRTDGRPGVTYGKDDVKKYIQSGEWKVL